MNENTGLGGSGDEFGVKHLPPAEGVAWQQRVFP